MLYAVGDSHSRFTFQGIPGTLALHLGPVTMWRAGNPAETMLQLAVATLAPTASDVVILCFGEIDCRCHVKLQLECGRELGAVLDELVDRYLAAAQRLPAHIGVLSVVPPTTKERSFNADFPVAGTDAERAGYVRALNTRLAAGCAARGLLYLDIYPHYADDRGMLIDALADNCVHVGDTRHVVTALRALGLP